jgi:hypothetical protein
MTALPGLCLESRAVRGIPALPLTHRPSNRRFAGPLSNRAPACTSNRVHCGRRLTGVRQRLGMVRRCRRRSAAHAARLKSACGRRSSVEDGSMRRRGFARVARAALYGSSGAGAGHDCERLRWARRPRIQRPACLRPKDAVASAHASEVVDTTRYAVVNPPLTAPNSRSHVQMESERADRSSDHLGLDIPSFHLCFERIQIRTALWRVFPGHGDPGRKANGPPSRTKFPTLAESQCTVWAF